MSSDDARDGDDMDVGVSEEIAEKGACVFVRARVRWRAW